MGSACCLNQAVGRIQFHEQGLRFPFPRWPLEGERSSLLGVTCIPLLLYIQVNIKAGRFFLILFFVNDWFFSFSAFTEPCDFFRPSWKILDSLLFFLSLDWKR